MSDGSDIVLTVDGTDITNKVMFDTATFESQLNAIPGTCEFTVKDPTRSLSFVTGKEITLSIDGTNYWGGYVTQIDRTHAFDADDTTAISSYDNRLWVIHGVDYNVLLDKRVLRDTANYLSQISFPIPGSTQDGAILRVALFFFVDNPTGFDALTYIDDTRQIHDFDTDQPWAWPAQGTKVRDLFEEMSKWGGQIYYIDADKNWHYHSLERAESRWGFSDQPNNAGITTATSQYQGATYGFREVEATEDGSVIINDALIWGGSALAGPGQAVFARVEDATSESDHGRTQYAEVRFGEPGFGLQGGVDARADVIVNGPPGTDIYGEQKGLRYPQWTFNFTWFGRDVPKISGVRQHIRPGSLVTIVMNVFGVTKLLPLRSLRLRFPGQAPDGKTFVTFTGEFGLQTTDPFTLWRYLLNNQNRIQSTIIAIADDTSTTTTYGAIGTFVPTPVTDGVTTVFDLPFGYISTTLEVFLNGLTQRSGTDFTESSPETGGFTMTSAPFSTDNLLVKCRTLAT